MKETAVEFLIQEIEKTDWWLIRKKIPLLIEQAKKMEKEQLQECWDACKRFNRPINEGDAPNFNEFIKQFKK
jgi:hypothetical protein